MIDNKVVNPIGGGNFGTPENRNLGNSEASSADALPKAKERYNSLDGLRALACIGIVAMHVKANIAVKPTDNMWTTNVISFTGDFVLLFMMVSAFAMSCGYFKRFQEGNIRMGDFYKKRYTRILPFFALLTIIDVLKTIAAEHFAWTEALKGELYEAFTNCTLMYGLIPNNDITVVGVGWFLGIIFLFYLCYPFFTFLIGSKKKAWIAFAVAIGLYFTTEYYFNPVKGSGFGSTSMMKCAPFFLMGGIAYVYRKSIVELMKSNIARIALWIVTVGYTAYFFVFPEYRFELANLVMYGLWLVYAVSEVSFTRKTTFLNNKVMAFLSNISMEVYLCHMMMFRVVEKLHLENKIADNDVCYYVSFVLILALAIAFSWIWKKWCEPKVLKKIE